MDVPTESFRETPNADQSLISPCWEKASQEMLLEEKEK